MRKPQSAETANTRENKAQVAQHKTCGKEKSPQLFQAAGFLFWCGWQELNPRPLGS
jgi:hypothetical protein